MASINFSLAAAILLSGLLILGTTTEPTEAYVCSSTMACAQGTYMTCTNTPGQYFYGCSCQCAPMGCTGCAVYLADGTMLQG